MDCRKISAIALFGVFTSLHSPAQTPVESSGPLVEQLILTVGKSLTIESPVKIVRLATANSDLVEAIAVGAKEVLLNGKAAGETSVIVWRDDGSRFTYDLKVRPSSVRLNAVRSQLAREFPGGDIDVTLDNETAFVRGKVKDLFSADRAVAIASTLGKTVNLLRVDIPPVEPEILLQVRFANVDRSASTTLGVNLINAAFNQTSAVGTGTPLSQFGQPPFSLSQAVNVFLFRRDINLGAAIQALEAKKQLQMLAEPNLMVINNTLANFVAGGEIPYPIVQAGTGSNAISIAFKEYGIKLGFLPVVTPRGTIRLQVSPEVSALDYTNSVTISGTMIPGTSIRRVQTEVELESGQSFVIAGLLDHQTTENFSKIPGISSIPVLGKLFQSRSVTRTNTELLVIITPEIVRPIGAGEPRPDVRFPLDFLPPLSSERTPHIDPAGSAPPRPDSLPVEQLIRMNKEAAAPPAPPQQLPTPGSFKTGSN